MSRRLLFLGLAVVLCGCGEDVKAPPVAANKQTGPADPVPPAKSDGTTRRSKPDADDEEVMDELAAAGKPEADDDEEKTTTPDDGDKEGDKESEKPGKVSLQKAFKSANKFMQKGDVKGALSELEKAVPDNPDDANLLLHLAALCQRAASDDKSKPEYEFYKKAADYFRRALKADTSLAENPNIGSFAGTTYYNEARALAKEDKPADALKALQEAVDMGFKDVDELEKEDDLAAVRELPEFPEFVTKTRATIQERQKREIDKIFAETKPFDFTFEATDIEGNAIAMADLKGKIAIIDVWGTWCPPCRMEIPHFIELQTKYKDAGVEIVGLNLERAKDDEEAVQLIQEFHKENKMNYRCAPIKQATTDQIPEFAAFPTTMFFDRTGKVRAKIVGYNPLEILEMIVSRLLEEKPEGDKPATEEKAPEQKAGGKPTEEKAQEKSDKEAKIDDAGK
jgi:thiol-disulfide isomerase/thioredoxin